MEIDGHWETIRRLFRKSFASSLHYAVATVDEDGSPSITPIGSLFLRRDRTGFFFDKYLRSLPRHLERNQRICVLAVNSSMFFWLRSLMVGRFETPPGVRLYGTVGERREARPEEIARFRKRISFLRFFKGYDLLWKDFEYARDVHFDSFEPIQAGAMTRDLWKD